MTQPELPVTLTAGYSRTFSVVEGDILTITGDASAKGTLARLGGATAIIGVGVLTIQKQYGTQTYTLVCSQGNISATVGYGAMGVMEVSTDTALVYGPSLPTTGIPAYWKRSPSSQMIIGDSIANQGAHLPITPIGRATRFLQPSLTNLNVNGLFIGPIEASITCVTGVGTLRFYASDSTVTWQAFGDTEGPRTLVSIAKCMYTFQSGSANNQIYIGVIPRFKPGVDKSDTINITGSGSLGNNCGTHGFASWGNALMGMPYDTSYSYSIPGIKATDWWDARADWINIYTDETIVQPGTNDCNNLAGAISGAAAVENIIMARQAIGSTVTVTGLLPYTGAAAGVNAAMMHFNGLVSALARKYNCDFSDPYAYMADPIGTGAYLSQYTGDGLHPSALGGYTWSVKTLVPVLSKRIRSVRQQSFAGIAYNASTAPYGNLAVNGQLTGVAGAKGSAKVTGEVPTSHTVAVESGSIATCVCTSPDSASPILRSDGKQGKYFRMVIDNTGGVFGEGFRFRPTGFVSSNIAIGDYFVLEGDVRISGTGIHKLEAFANLDGAIGSALVAAPFTSGYGMGDLNGDTVTLQFRSAPMRLETNVSGVIWGIVALAQIGGVFTVDVGQTINLHKVPAP